MCEWMICVPCGGLATCVFLPLSRWDRFQHPLWPWTGLRMAVNRSWMNALLQYYFCINDPEMKKSQASIQSAHLENSNTYITKVFCWFQLCNRYNLSCENWVSTSELHFLTNTPQAVRIGWHASSKLEQRQRTPGVMGSLPLCLHVKMMAIPTT